MAICRRASSWVTTRMTGSGPRQEPAQRARVTAQRVVEAFAVGHRVAVRVLPEPVPVGLDRLAVEVAGPDLVEARFGQDRYRPAA